MIQKGYFLITDITGYTNFLTQSELDHAQHIIEALFESQLQVIKAPLIVSGFQGDAIICYAPEEATDDGRAVFGQIDGIYAAFAAKMAEMQIDPPCSCRICSTISLLDLKIFVHYGEYLVKKLGDREELMGTDIIVIHRLMKNHVKEALGMNSYLLVTDAAYARMQNGEGKAKLNRHSESYDDVGQIEVHVAPLAAG